MMTTASTPISAASTGNVHQGAISAISVYYGTANS